MVRKTGFTVAAFTAAALFSFISFAQSGDWTPLLDKKLSQWDTYLSFAFTADYKGEVVKDENGNLVEPVGYNNDESEVFSIVKENKELILKVSGEIYGGIFTKQEYENYHLKLKVKWGAKKWPARKDKLMDSGILYHSIGECGVDYWRSWMISQEFQVMEGHMGDYWSIQDSKIDIRAYPHEGNINAVASKNQPFLPFGKGERQYGFCKSDGDYESPAGEWTTLELVCFEGKSLHIVNGTVVMILQNSRYLDGEKTIPLTKGKILLQSEAAEVFYKDIAVKKLESLPSSYASYF
ncbi:MAG: DUF1080 domain-containing protein [Cyclobacteriaceae bacterium]